MNRGGLPPVPDQLSLRRWKAFAIAIGFVVLIGACVVVQLLLDRPRPPVARVGPPTQSNLNEAEVQRADAYQAMRHQAEQMLAEYGINNVYWRKSFHTVARGRYEFTGTVDVVLPEGTIDPRSYEAILMAHSDYAWTLESIRIGGETYPPEKDAAR